MRVFPRCREVCPPSLSREAAEVLGTLKHEDDPERFEEGLKRYIKLRYLLDDDSYWDDDLD